jgi:dTDP-4-dehydrorhamnose reductase
MILILGASGYVGKKFQTACQKKGLAYTAISRNSFNYYDDGVLDSLLDAFKPHLVINAAGFTGKPNVEACETMKDQTILGNIVLPVTIAKACARHEVVFGHVSSGCIYDGYSKEFTEDDEPNFCFKTPKHSFYSGTKAQAEELIRGIQGLKSYIWRLRIPFDEYASPRNYITKLLSYPKLVSASNSLSHLQDFTNACLNSFVSGVEFGTYNLTNVGHISAKEITEIWTDLRGRKGSVADTKTWDFWPSVEEFNKVTITPRSNCVLCTDKAAKANLGMRHVRDAITEAIIFYGHQSQ